MMTIFGSAGALRTPSLVRTPAMRLTAIALALAVAVLLLAACQGDDAMPPAPAATTAPAASQGQGQTPAATQPAAMMEQTPAPTTAAQTQAQAPAPTQPSSAQAPAATPSPTATPASMEPVADPINVVASNTILADMARQIGGNLVEVSQLIPPGFDVHAWQSAPRDSVRITEAAVIISNGTALAPQVDDLIDNAASADAVRVVASEGLDAIELVELPFPGMDDHGHGHGDDDHGDEEMMADGRLLIGDGETGQLSVIDLESGMVTQDAFDLGSRAGRIYATASGRYAIAVSSDADNAHIFDGGIYLVEHGDHFDRVEAEVRRMDIDLMGDNPVHMYVDAEWSTIYYDGSGDVVLIEEHELEHDGDDYVPPKFNAGPHHGASIPLEGDVFATTVQHPDFASDPEQYRLPTQVSIRGVDGTTRYTADAQCPDLHGDAGNGHIAVFGCTGGVLMVEAHDGAYEDAFIPAPAGSADDFRLTSVWGKHGLDHFFALGSAAGLYLVEPEMGMMEQVIPATDALRPIQVALSYDGELLLVVMSDGELRMYDAHDADLMMSATGILSDAIDPGFWARPHIATAPGRIFITDSGADKVIALDAHDLEEVRHWDVTGTPTKIAFVGIQGKGDDHNEHGDEGHDDHDDHDDDHSDAGHDDHGHDHGAGDPHFWQNPRLAVHYAEQIAAGLAQADPANAAAYQANAAAYIGELNALDEYISAAVAGIPAAHRTLVTFHDAFGYFGARYGLQVMAFVGGHGGDVAPSDIVNVLNLVRDQGLPAVFAEPQFSADAVEQVARDAGIKVGIIRSIPDRPDMGYIEMMRSNADALAESLR